MKNTMWIQSENIGGNDYYFSDGLLIPEDNATALSKASNKLLNVQLMKECLSKRNLRLKKETEYPNFTLAYSLVKGFLYKSVFNEFSKSGRRRGFVYWCKYSDINNLWSNIEKCSSTFKFTIRTIDKPIVEEYIKIVKKRRIVAIFVSIAIITILILIITIVICQQ